MAGRPAVTRQADAAALHQPYITEVDDNAMRLRGLEEVQLVDGKVAAVLQEWLVSPTRPVAQQEARRSGPC